MGFKRLIDCQIADKKKYNIHFLNIFSNFEVILWL